LLGRFQQAFKIHQLSKLRGELLRVFDTAFYQSNAANRAPPSNVRFLGFPLLQGVGFDRDEHFSHYSGMIIFNFRNGGEKSAEQFTQYEGV
jgi:hypothetical protein